MNKDFESKMTIRNEEVDGENQFYWLEGDFGSWDGPKEDWIKSHKFAYFDQVTNFNVVVTAGGNQGLYTRLYSKLFKTVYTFEPDALNFHILCMNNQVDNVIKLNAALGEHAGFTGLARASMTNTGMHRVDHSPGIIPILKLDNFELPELNFLQLDVEGYEIHALRGARDTIDRCKPVIALECGKTTCIEKFMLEMGYAHFMDSVADTVYKPK